VVINQLFDNLWLCITNSCYPSHIDIDNLFTTQILIFYILIALSVYDVTILLFHSMAKPASAFSMVEPACGSWWRPSVTEFGSVTEGRSGLEWYLFISTIWIRPNFNLMVKIVFFSTPQCFSLEARFPNER
jgi:hypothetical protein